MPFTFYISIISTPTRLLLLNKAYPMGFFCHHPGNPIYISSGSETHAFTAPCCPACLLYPLVLVEHNHQWICQKEWNGNLLRGHLRVWKCFQKLHLMKAKREHGHIEFKIRKYFHSEFSSWEQCLLASTVGVRMYNELWFLFIGDHSAWRGKCGPAPTQKGQWGARSGTQDPRSQTGSPMGNKACIVPRPLWGFLLLKLPHPELRQQMFSAYL